MFIGEVQGQLSERDRETKTHSFWCASPWSKCNDHHVWTSLKAPGNSAPYPVWGAVIQAFEPLPLLSCALGKCRKLKWRTILVPTDCGTVVWCGQPKVPSELLYRIPALLDDFREIDLCRDYILSLFIQIYYIVRLLTYILRKKIVKALNILKRFKHWFACPFEKKTPLENLIYI